MKLKLKKLNNEMPDLISSPEDSGYDLRACVDRPLVIDPMGKVTIPTGIAVEIEDEDGYFATEDVSVELQVRPRSGHTKIGLIAQFGTVDRGYRGEIYVTVINFSSLHAEIHPQERIAQLVVVPIFKPTIELVNTLSDSDRGNKGFGSSGKL